MPDAAIAQLRGRFGGTKISAADGADDANNGNRNINNPGNKIPMVVGAAFPRTGTNSLKLALGTLGFGKCYHIQEMCEKNHLPLWDVPDADYRRRSFTENPPDYKAILDGYRSGVDVPFCLHALDIWRAFPGSKVVLTLRDGDKWHKSCFDTIFKHDGLPAARRMAYEAIPELKALYDWEVRSHWGPDAWDFQDKESAINAYLAYQEEVRATVPPEDLLEFRVQDGWQPLCDFLQVPVPPGDAAFPHVNDTAQQLEEAERLDAIGVAIQNAVKDR